MRTATVANKCVVFVTDQNKLLASLCYGNLLSSTNLAFTNLPSFTEVLVYLVEGGREGREGGRGGERVRGGEGRRGRRKGREGGRGGEGRGWEGREVGEGGREGGEGHSI